jgi:hypothetical protein
MDFKWVTSDDANAIQNAIVDAKGDIIAATANDTPARLAVGADYRFLQALASESTGLSYGGAWQSWTPTWGSLTVGNGTTDARYMRVGNTVFYYIAFTLGSTSAVTGDVNFTLPQGFAGRGRFNGTSFFLDDGVQAMGGTIEYAADKGYFRIGRTDTTWLSITTALTSTTPFTWGTGDLMVAYSWYEVA